MKINIHGKKVHITDHITNTAVEEFSKIKNYSFVNLDEDYGDLTIECTKSKVYHLHFKYYINTLGKEINVTEEYVDNFKNGFMSLRKKLDFKLNEIKLGFMKTHNPHNE